MRIPLSSPDIKAPEIAAVTSVLRTSTLSLGPKLEEFESALAHYSGTSHAIAVSSGTGALHLCIRALGIGEGDEVILPSFAFIAVANAVRYERAVPVFVDVEAETLNLDPNKVEAAITAKTRAILVVHTFGCPAALSTIIGIARRYHLSVIEDACEAIGAEYAGHKVGSFGDVGVFAFYPNKQITTGEGGVIVTQHAEIAECARWLRNQGRDPSRDWLQHTGLGYNYRLPEMSCALGIEQLKRIDAILKRRAEIASGYERRLRSNVHLRLPPLSLPERAISWFAYVVRLSGRFAQCHRDRIYHAMSDRGIGCGRYFAPIHLQPAYHATLTPGTGLRVTEWHAARTLALPFFNEIAEAQMDEVCAVLNELASGAAL